MQNKLYTLPAKRTISFLLLALAFLFIPAPTRAGRIWKADSFPIVHLQDANRYVCDPEGILSPSTRDTIDLLLHNLQQRKGIETVVAIAGRIENGNAYEWGMALARKHKVGNAKQNTGLIVVLATVDRSYYILTGSGLEGTLPDAVCSRIERTYMVPRLKLSDWDGAMLAGIKAICSHAMQDPSLLPARKRRTDSDGNAPLVAGIIVAGIVGATLYAMRKQKKQASTCPRCGHHALERTEQTISLTQTPAGKRKRIYRCSNCGYTETRDDDSPGGRGQNSGNSILPLIMLGLMSGRHSGGWGRGYGGRGGFGSGGSFGGGNFGGGGAGGRF